MGGAAAGELASAMAADLIHRHLATAWATDPDASAERFAFRMREAVELANAADLRLRQGASRRAGHGNHGHRRRRLRRRPLPRADRRQPRATWSAAATAIQLTKDQSLMQRLVDAGELTEEEAEQSERRNIILQALGPDPRVKVDLTHQTLRRGDTLIICSDGLSGLVRARGVRRSMVARARRSRLALQRAHRPRQRAGRARQHHRGGGALRGRRPARAVGAPRTSGYQVFDLPDETTAKTDAIQSRTASARRPPAASAARAAPPRTGVLLPVAALCLLAARARRLALILRSPDARPVGPPALGVDRSALSFASGPPLLLLQRDDPRLAGRSRA